MPRDFLHNHRQFAELVRIVADEKRIDPALVEKDYWIMHCLWGLQQLGHTFQLKGGTSLSKGHQIISRFSEDIDILVELGRHLSLLDVVGIQQELEDALGRNVDLVEYAAIKPLLKECILAQEVRIL